MPLARSLMWLRLAGLARWAIVLAWVVFWVLVALQWWPTRVRLGWGASWFWACRDEAIDPRHPTRLPLLFALDAKLAIEGGFRYLPDCSDIHRKSDAGGDGGQCYCGTSFSDGSHGGDGDGFGGADDSGGGDGGDGGGGGD